MREQVFDEVSILNGSRSDLAVTDRSDIAYNPLALKLRMPGNCCWPMMSILFSPSVWNDGESMESWIKCWASMMSRGSVTSLQEE